MLTDRLPAVAGRFQEAGLYLGIEADGGTFVPSTERMLRLLGLCASPALVANFDACNLYMGGSDPIAAVQQLAGRVVNGHIKRRHLAQEASRCEVAQLAAIGAGELNWVRRSACPSGRHNNVCRQTTVSAWRCRNASTSRLI